MGLRRCSVALSLVALMLVATTRAEATPITIVETLDFSDTSPGSIIGAFDVGSNTISGSVNLADLANSDLADYFMLTLPASTELVGVDLAISNYDGTVTYTNGVASITTSGLSYAFLLDMVGGSSILSLTSSGNFTVSLPPIRFGPDTARAQFLFSTNFVVPIGFNILDGGGYDYSLTYHVESVGTPPPSAVPEPTSLLLIGSGLIGAGARRWRQRRKTA